MGNPIFRGCPYQVPDGFNDRNRFPPGHCYIGEIENGKRYPLGVYTKEEADSLFAVKQTEDELASLADIVSEKADQSDLDTLSERVDAMEPTANLGLVVVDGVLCVRYESEVE